MAPREVICVFILAVSLNLILAIENDIADADSQNEKNVRVVGRAYSLTGCDYSHQAGYTCLSCHRALHCYLGGAAIMVDCYGLFRYCRDGRCSRKQDTKCTDEIKLTTAATDIEAGVQSHDDLTLNVTSVSNDPTNIINAKV